MPIYAYKCADCGHEKEVLQKITDAPLVECPACGHASMAKMVTAAGFQLKGSGWYATDFRNKDSGAKPSTAKTESANDAKAGSGTDSPSPSGDKPTATAHACGSGGCASCS